MWSGSKPTRYEMKSSYLRTGWPIHRRCLNSFGKTQHGTTAKGLRVRMAYWTICSVAWSAPTATLVHILKSIDAHATRKVSSTDYSGSYATLST